MSEASRGVPLFHKTHRVEEGRALLESLIESTGARFVLAVIRLRPGQPYKERVFDSTDEAKAGEATLLKEAADHVCSAGCGRWRRLLTPPKPSQPA